MAIERDAYTKKDGVKVPIDYVRGTNTIPIVIHFRDFEIPSGATAQVFVHKPSGMAVYNKATISGNDVTVDVVTQMFAEVGYSKMQIQISQEEKDLVSFVQPVNVQENYTDGEADESQNESNFFDEYIGKINEAIDDAETATEGANTAAQSANEAAGAANEAAGEATTAAGTANKAAQSANTATNAASQAAQSANSAATAANQAAQEIEEKAENGDFSATVAIGNVTTGQPGSQATVKNTGTAKDAVLDFSIPQGQQGPKGDTGPQGPKGDTGPQGPKGDTGEVENIDTVQVDFTQAASRQNIASGETFATMFGKIAKWFADLGTAAFQGVSNALTQTKAGYVLDARQGKALDDAKLNKTSVINNLLTTVAGYVLDARQGKILDDKITQTNADLAAITYALTEGTLGLASRKYWLKKYNDGTFELVAFMRASKVAFTWSTSTQLYFILLTANLPDELTVDLTKAYSFSGSAESSGIYFLTLQNLAEKSIGVYLSANAYSGNPIDLIESAFTLKGFWK